VTHAANPLAGKRIVLGVAGGIAAYKAVELLRLLVKAGATVQVVMTDKARAFVGPLTFQALSGRPVFSDLFSLTQESEIGHIEAADAADLIIIAPATATTMARMAAGLANDALTAVVLATTAPVLLAPSMNVNMWNDPITQRNVRQLVELGGMRTVGPGSGFLACQWIGPGRLAEPADIIEAASRVLTEPDLRGRRIVVSAGPTREALDPVRFLSNRSSGRMGYAIALAAARRGAEVTLVSGPTSLEPPLGVELERVTTAAEMGEAVARAAAAADAVVMAAAIADYTPAAPGDHKLKKSDQAPALELVRTIDVLASLGRARGDQLRPVLVGFAAETQNVVVNARAKLAGKPCDLVVANDVSQADAGFEVDTNRVILVDRAGEQALALASKLEIGHAILDRIAALLDRVVVV
jgi:phosphopantothenoylcysteine decarboxylase/phosphopantothenate--cysteine ligase